MIVVKMENGDIKHYRYPKKELVTVDSTLKNLDLEKKKAKHWYENRVVDEWNRLRSEVLNAKFQTLGG